LHYCRLPKKQDMTKKLWSSFSAWFVYNCFIDLLSPYVLYHLLMLLKCIFQLIRRRYFSNEPAAPSPWSLTPREDSILPVVTPKDDADTFQRKRWACLTWNTLTPHSKKSKQIHINGQESTKESNFSSPEA
jgi:hypothetical protein